MTGDDFDDVDTGATRRRAKDSLRLIAWPLLAYFDRRFQDVYNRLDERLDRLYDRIATEVETISEMTLGMQRFVDTSGQQIEDLIAEVKELRAALDRRLAEENGNAAEAKASEVTVRT